MPVPAELPLDLGRVTCLTCHDEDLLRGHEDGGGRPTGAALRARSEAGRCASCHAEGPSRRSPHGMSMLRAHLEGTSRTDRRAASAGAGLDSESQECVACHDGTAAPDAGHSRDALAGFNPATDHPVGVAYRSRPASARSEEIRLVDVHSLNPKVRLFEGQVGCGSCHSPYSPRKSLLVMSNLGSQLCLSCHIQ